jgi:hypothetical protein
VNILRRHPIALTLLALVLLSALRPLPALVDAVTGAPPAEADLVRPIVYTALAPLSNILDALTFLSLERARALLIGWTLALAAWGALRRGSPRRRVGRALLGPLAVVVAGGAVVVLPRPVPRLVTPDSAVTVIDYHAHTDASHDGRAGWTAEKLAAWHAAQGFQASYVTDHNEIFTRRTEEPPPNASPTSRRPPPAIRLLPGVEWSVSGQHIVALGAVSPIDRTVYNRDTRAMLRLFAELHRQGALGLVSLPEYWRNHWDKLDDFVAAGADGFEIVNCAPKAIGFPAGLRAQVLRLAARHNLLVVGASDNHGWGKVTCVWNLSGAGARGYAANRVVARPIALSQGEGRPWTAAYTQPWLMIRSLSWSERSSWITWILVILIYRAVPRRAGDPHGIGILARSLSLKIFRPGRPKTAEEYIPRRG